MQVYTPLIAYKHLTMWSIKTMIYKVCRTARQRGATWNILMHQQALLIVKPQLNPEHFYAYNGIFNLLYDFRWQSRVLDDHLRCSIIRHALKWEWVFSEDAHLFKSCLLYNGEAVRFHGCTCNSRIRNCDERIIKSSFEFFKITLEA